MSRCTTIAPPPSDSPARSSVAISRAPWSAVRRPVKPAPAELPPCTSTWWAPPQSKAQRGSGGNWRNPTAPASGERRLACAPSCSRASAARSNATCPAGPRARASRSKARSDAAPARVSRSRSNPARRPALPRSAGLDALANATARTEWSSVEPRSRHASGRSHRIAVHDERHRGPGSREVWRLSAL